MIYPLLLVPFTTLITLVSIGWYKKSDLEVSLNTNSGSSSFIKLVTLLSLYVNLIYSSILWKLYPRYTIWQQEVILIYPGSEWFQLQHNLNLPFVLLSTAVLIIALLTAWYSQINVLLFTSLLLISEICLVGSFSCTNLFVFLLFFEASALPIFILIVYCGSPRRERLKASFYFLFFTFYGSLSLLLLLINLHALIQIEYIDQSTSNYTLWPLLFIAFAAKIPLFPFHIWLPYAHVEASTATSIILAALMLKLGGYGLIRFMLPLFTREIHLYFRPLALFISVIGVVYGSMCAIRQIDLKRQIAFSSIAHMSFAVAGIFTFTEVGIKGAIYLMLSHGFTSSALFFLVGVLSDRYHTRSSMAFGGLLGLMPILSFFFIVASLANVGFPGTSGFLPEIFILVAVLSSSPFILWPLLLGMLLTTAGTLVTLLRLLFGHAKSLYLNAVWSDVTKLEFFVLSILSVLMLIFGFYDLFAKLL